ncbi:protein ORF37 [Lake sturgeon herpesvirus]|nr:protein ORF37 [Lake sturgeon herpesvirus]
MFKKELAALVKYGKNYCNTNINLLYKHSSYNLVLINTIQPENVDVTPDLLLLTQGLLTICNKLKAEIQTDQIMKHMISGVKHPMTPFPYCFTYPIEGLNLNLTKTPTLPPEVPLKYNYTNNGGFPELVPLDQIVLEVGFINTAVTFFIRTCYLAHQLCNLADKYQSSMNPYGLSMSSIMKMVIKHIPYFKNPMPPFVSMSEDHVVYVEVFMVFVELTFALHTLVASYLDSQVFQTYHKDSLVKSVSLKCRQNPPVQDQYLTRAQAVVNRYSQNY